MAEASGRSFLAFKRRMGRTTISGMGEVLTWVAGLAGARVSGTGTDIDCRVQVTRLRRQMNACWPPVVQHSHLQTLVEACRRVDVVPLPCS